MARVVIAGADLAARRAARESHARPWVQSQTPSTSSIRNRPALQTTVVSAVTEVPPVVINEPVTLPEVMPVSSLLPAGSKSRIPVKAAGLEKLPAVQTSSSSTPSSLPVPVAPVAPLPAPLPVVLPAAAPAALPGAPAQPRSCLRKSGTKPKKTVSWDANNEWATYTKGMKTKFWGREQQPALLEDGDSDSDSESDSDSDRDDEQE